jgi:glutamate-5-semialdehyde dehydrogenase
MGMADSTTASRFGDLPRRVKDASRLLATARTAEKDHALLVAADLLEESAGELISANEADLASARGSGATESQLDRLRLDRGRIAQMAGALREVASLSDPVGEVVGGWVRPNGLRVTRVRVPLGVVGVIYENRPNVTSDAAGLCLKSGNAVMLRGSSSAFESNRAIVGVMRAALSKVGLPEDAIALVEDTSREGAVAFMQLQGVIDCLIPRGGPSLVASVRENATVPVVVDGDGNCHVYVDASADLDMALTIVVNAKTQRPSVCNAAETLLVHKDVAAAFLPRAKAAMEGVELLGDERARSILPSIAPATDEDFATEFLALKMSVAVVDSLDAAISHIARYGTGHSEAIVTKDLQAAERFSREVDAAAVLVNASTRFVDGGELGLGAEIGISTQKLHARGPMGLRELTSVKLVIQGEGQVRE